MRVLDGIDSRLKELLPPEEFEEVSARPSQMVSLPSTQKSFNESEQSFSFVLNCMLYAEESTAKVREKMICALLYVVKCECTVYLFSTH